MRTDPTQAFAHFGADLRLIVPAISRLGRRCHVGPRRRTGRSVCRAAPHQPRKKYGRRRPAQMEPHMVGSIGRNPRWPKPRARPTDAEMGAHDAGRARWGKHPGKSKFTLANASPVKFQHPVRFLVWSFFVAGNLVCDARRVGFCTHPTGRGIPGCAPPHLHAPPQTNRRRIEITIAHQTQSLNQPNP